MTCWYCGRFGGADIKVWKAHDACADCFGEQYDRWIENPKAVPRQRVVQKQPKFEHIKPCQRCDDRWEVSQLKNGYCWNCVKLLAAIAEDKAERAAP